MYVCAHIYADTQTGRQTDRQAGIQTGKQTDRQADRQTDRQANRQTDRQTDRQTGRQTDRQTGRQTDRQTDRQTGRQAYRQANRQTYRQTDRQADRQTDSVPSLSKVRGILSWTQPTLTTHWTCIQRMKLVLSKRKFTDPLCLVSSVNGRTPHTGKIRRVGISAGKTKNGSPHIATAPSSPRHHWWCQHHFQHQHHLAEASRLCYLSCG